MESEKNFTDWVELMTSKKLWNAYPWDVNWYWDADMINILGYAYDGTIVIYNILRKMVPEATTLEEHLHFTVLFNDYIANKCQKWDKYYIILDTQGFGYANIDMERFKTNAPLSGRLVPDILKKAFVVRCGWLIKTIYASAKGFIHERTRPKISVMGDDNVELRKVLSEVMDPKLIPKELGGDGKSFE